MLQQHLPTGEDLVWYENGKHTLDRYEESKEVKRLSPEEVEYRVKEIQRELSSL